jgi:hypothetical protein
MDRQAICSIYVYIDIKLLAKDTLKPTNKERILKQVYLKMTKKTRQLSSKT